nr:MAG TPA: hypothetical protein [Bacteriophage sp.]
MIPARYVIDDYNVLLEKLYAVRNDAMPTI